MKLRAAEPLPQNAADPDTVPEPGVPEQGVCMAIYVILMSSRRQLMDPDPADPAPPHPYTLTSTAVFAAPATVVNEGV